MKLPSFIILVVFVCYVFAVGYNVVTIEKDLNEEFLEKKGISLALEVASRLGVVATFGIIGDILSNTEDAASILQDERILREFVNVLFDWYAPIKWSPVLSVSKEVGWIMISARIKHASTNLTGSNGASSGEYAYVRSDALNVRAGPSADYNALTRLNKNTRVQIIDKSGSWWKIKYENIEGYVNSVYLGK
jgi:uncharacterized protein YgiM (DUF1202 family)